MQICDLGQEQNEISNNIDSNELYKHDQSFKLCYITQECKKVVQIKIL